MKKSTFFIVTILVFAIACKPKPQPTLSYISGIYSIAGCKVQMGKNVDSLQNAGLLNFRTPTFTFLENDSVIISPETGMRFFGDSVFKFELTEKSLLLTNNQKQIELACTVRNNFKLLDLVVNEKDLETIQLIRLNK